MKNTDLIKKKYLAIEKGAMVRNIKFELTVDDYKIYYNQPCYYCGVNSIGLDRIDSAIHYCKTNIVPCCTICNMMKSTLERDAFIIHCTKIAINHDRAGSEKYYSESLILKKLAGEVEKEIIVSALKNNLNCKSKTAEQLSISTTTLWRKMKTHNITASYT